MKFASVNTKVFFLWFRSLMDSDFHDQMKDLISHGQVDDALALYQKEGMESAHACNMIGTFYAQKKGDFHLAIQYYNKALEILEKVDDLKGNIEEKYK